MNEEIPLIKANLNKDSKVITDNLKDIFQKEEEYAMFLYAIEESVTAEYYDNKKLKDKEVIKYLNNFLKNLDESFNFFSLEFEKHLYLNILDALEEKKITKHELKLCIRYILWSIDNRSWLNDNQAYVKWIAHASGTMGEKEAKEYERKIRIFCRRKGIPKSQVDAMLSNNFDDVELEDKDSTLIENRYFALEDNKKLELVLDNFQEAPFLDELYSGECIESNDFNNAEKLCKGILEIMPDFPPIEHLLGVVYKEKGNKYLAKIQFEKVLKLLEEIPKGAFEGQEDMEKETKQMLKEIED